MSSNPQTERDPETLALFVEESLEGLQQIDQLLLEAERGQPAANMLATLFRAVHTIKGTAGYLAYEKTQALSHVAEDLLSRLRDKKLEAQPDHFACLIVVGDRLRQLVENVKKTGEEGNVEVQSLVAQLKAMQGAPAVAPASDPAASGAVNAPVTAATVAAAALGGPAMPAPGAQPAAASAAALSIPASSAPSASPAAAAMPGAAAAGALPAEAVQAPAAPVAKHDDEPAKDKPAAAAAAKAEGDGSVRVNVAVLDRLMNLIGELVLARNQLAQTSKVSGDGTLGNQASFQRLNVVTTELQEQVMKTRMQPVARVFEKIPRMVRDVARVVGKEVNCVIEGNNTEIDKALVEAIRDPVMHIVRNALDHGIESPAERKKTDKPPVGTLFVRAAHKGGAVTIEVEDDGRGMDPAFIRGHAVKKGVLTQQEAALLSARESLELVFRPGFSTAAQVTDISGRGVGMDVVRTHVEQAGGHAEIESVYGRGTTIRLKMPLTLAIIPALLVRAQGQRFAIPQVNLLELVYLTDEQRQVAIEMVRGVNIHRLRGEILPVVHLREALGMAPREGEAPEGTYIVVLASGQRRYSLIVDAIDNTEEIVIKPLRGQLKRLTSYSGATVLGDGGVALILDVVGIATKAGIDLSAARRAEVAPSAGAATSTQPAMVFISGGLQCAVPLSIVSRLEQVAAAAIERVGDQEILQYRGSLLPILRPALAMGLSMDVRQAAVQTLIVFDFGRPIALAVDEIVDVTEVDLTSVTLRDQSPYTSGKTVVLGKTTLVVDVYALLADLAPKALRRAAPLRSEGQILVVDPSDAMRGSLVSYLQESGYRAQGLASADALFKELQNAPAGKYATAVLDANLFARDLGKGLQQFKALCKDISVVVSHEDEHFDEASWSQKVHVHGSFSKTKRGHVLDLLTAPASDGRKQP